MQALSHRVLQRTTASSNTTDTPNYNKRRLQRCAFLTKTGCDLPVIQNVPVRLLQHPPTEHQPPVDANSSSKSQVANTTTTLFGPSSTRPTFFSHEKDEILHLLHLLHLDLSARRRPVQLVIALSLTIIRYATTTDGTFTFQSRQLTRWGQEIVRVESQPGQDPRRSYWASTYIITTSKQAIYTLPTLVEPIISASVYYLADGRRVSLQAQ